MKKAIILLGILALAVPSLSLAVKKKKTDDRGHHIYICNFWGSGGTTEVIRVGPGKFRVYGGSFRGIVEVGGEYAGVLMSNDTATNAARVGCGEID